MKRPLSGKRPIGPLSQLKDSDNGTIGILYLEAEDNEIFDRSKIEGGANRAIDVVEGQLEQPVKSLSPWTEDQVESFIGWNRRGVYIVVEQRDKFFGKPSPTYTRDIEDVRQQLERRKGIGKLHEYAFIQDT